MLAQLNAVVLGSFAAYSPAGEALEGGSSLCMYAACGLGRDVQQR
jgi:hypothetical protein